MINFNQQKEEKQIFAFTEPNGEQSNVFVKPIISNPNELPKFKITLKNPMGMKIEKAYIYFYVDLEKYKSQFIGVSVNSSYTGRSYANLLISTYIDVCNQSHIYDLATHNKQRKPEVIHILKKFGYNVDNEID